MANEPQPLLEVEDLKVHFTTPRGVARVVDGASLTVGREEVFGIAGESGCGKTTLVEAILQIIRFPNRVMTGSVRFHPKNGRPLDLVGLSPNEMRRVRGEHISYVPQGSMNSLNPVMRIGAQIVDAMTTHGVSERDAKRRVPDLLGKVGLEPKVATLRPHELSGGMKQRVIIAIAISLGPDLIVADEPTTALDVNVQRFILETLVGLRRDLGVAIMIVSHDLPVHAQLADRLGVMYAGQVVETGPVRPVLKEPLHPYTAGLMAAIPAVGDDERIRGIEGSSPSPLAWPEGCRFHPRCPRRMEICTHVEPLLAEIAPGRLAACHLYPESRGEGATETDLAPLSAVLESTGDAPGDVMASRNDVQVSDGEAPGNVMASRGAVQAPPGDKDPGRSLDGAPLSSMPRFWRRLGGAPASQFPHQCSSHQNGGRP